jgi:Kef-type K+ transport system membrane component KefB
VGNIFLDITIIISFAALLSILFRILRQPQILAYILTGVLIGPLGFFRIANQDALHSMSQFGITLLLFMIGLEIRVSDLFQLGKNAILAALGQIVFTFLTGFAISGLLGFPLLVSVYIAVALTFSSTVIIVKLLSDKQDMHSLYGKISLVILLAQDLVAILFLMVLSSLNSQVAGFASVAQIGMIFVKAILLFAIVIYLSKSVFPKLVELIAKSPETLFLVSIAWVFGFAAFVSSRFIGFSIEIGGFLAGLSLANSIANYQIIAKAKILRDFFIVMFFVLLGLQMSFVNVFQIIIPALILLIFTVALKPLIIMSILGALGYRKRTAFLTGISLSQVSEFSLVLVFMGEKLGHLNKDIVSLITLVGIVGFVSSTYLVIASNKIYKKIGHYFSFLERKQSKAEQIVLANDGFEDLKDHVVIIGGDQMGQSILDALEKKDAEIVLIDFDPAVVKRLENRDVHRLFGDISDLDIQERAKLDSAKLVISTIPDVEDNLILLKELQHENRRAKIVAMALDGYDAKLLYDAGADYVILPHLAGGRQIAKLIKENRLDEMNSLKAGDKAYLN